MDAQTLLRKRLVPAQSVHRWMTSCDRGLYDKRQSVGCAVLEGLKQRQVSAFRTTYLQWIPLSLRHLAPLVTHKSRTPIQSPSFNLNSKNADLLL